MIKEYYERVEKAHLDILESIEPIDKSITLWWGLNGLRVSEDEKLEWVSRRKPKSEPISQLAQAQYPDYSYCHSAQLTANMLHLIDVAQAQNTQTWLQNSQIFSPSYPAYCATVPYLCGGLTGCYSYRGMGIW